MVRGQVGDNIAFTQFGVELLDPSMGKHPGRQIDAGKRSERQVADCQRGHPCAAAKIENGTDRAAGGDVWVPLQQGSHSTWNAVAQ